MGGSGRSCTSGLITHGTAANARVIVDSQSDLENNIGALAVNDGLLYYTVGNHVNDDAELWTTQLDQVVAYDPAEMLVVVQAGIRCGVLADLLEVELTVRRIPFVKFGGLKFLEAAHVKDLLALCRVAVNPRDDLAWFRSLWPVYMSRTSEIPTLKKRAPSSPATARAMKVLPHPGGP